VRELFNGVEQVALQLPASSARREAPAWNPYYATRTQALEDFNRAYFAQLVQRGANVSQLARDAGLDRRYLLRMLERYGITRARRQRSG
jgi:DNA-binding NtrC family response regulator